MPGPAQYHSINAAMFNITSASCLKRHVSLLPSNVVIRYVIDISLNATTYNLTSPALSTRPTGRIATNQPLDDSRMEFIIVQRTAPCSAPTCRRLIVLNVSWSVFLTKAGTRSRCEPRRLIIGSMRKTLLSLTHSLSLFSEEKHSNTHAKRRFSMNRARAQTANHHEPK